MNLARALDVALPEPPAKKVSRDKPRLHPKVVAREHVTSGKTEVAVLMPGTGLYFRFTPEEWAMLQLFDGTRTYEEVSQLAAEQLHMDVPVDVLKQFVANNDFWYKSPAEQAFEYRKRLEEQRGKRFKTRAGEGADLSMVELIYWNPDALFGKFHDKVKWVYSRWFTILTLWLFAFMTYIFIDRWGEIGHDTFEYYNFTHKSGWDILEFYVLFGVLAALHESAHGLTCKHFGGGVHKMGMLLIYLSPAFFVDVVEAWIYASKWQRVMTMLAGLWVELIVCAGMTIVWWGTAPGTWTHELAYKFMLIGGIAVVIINMNPLIKMDGYHIFAEILGMPDLKEASTAYTSAWVRRYLFGLPVPIEPMRYGKTIFFLVYSALSGLYAYTLLFVIVSFSYNVLRSYTPEWAFVPAGLLGYKIFKSRIQNGLRLMKTVYLDKKAKWGAFLRRKPVAMSAAGLALFLLFAPVWRDSVEGRFVLEPGERAVVRAEVPGNVAEVNVEEGQAVAAGQTLVGLRNLKLDSEAGRAYAGYRQASARLLEAQIRLADFSKQNFAAQEAAEKNRLLADQVRRLQITSPITGVVLTPRMHDLLGAELQAGSAVTEVGNLSTMRARIFLPEAFLRKVREGYAVSLKLDSMFQPRQGKVTALSPTAVEVAPGLMPETQYRGAAAGSFYAVSVLLPNQDATLRDGMSGTAKVFGPRHSLVWYGWEIVSDFLGRKLW